MWSSYTAGSRLLAPTVKRLSTHKRTAFGLGAEIGKLGSRPTTEELLWAEQADLITVESKGKYRET